jgi:hypothetical protein
MTETEWRGCEDARRLLAFLLQTRSPSDRKLLLFVSGFWRRQADYLKQPPDTGLRKRTEMMETWAETGKPPRRVRKTRLPGIIFFAEPPVAATTTASAPYQWVGGKDAENGRWAVQIQPHLLRCLFGNPFRPLLRRSLPPHVLGLAQSIYAAFPAVSPDHAILADALEELGETEAAMHCRQGFHARGCHVIDWCLDKE